MLEHVVDTVLYFEGERHHSHRVVRAVKNRFGAVSELGVFEMTGAGPAAGAESVGAVPGRAARANVAGSAVLCCDRRLASAARRVQALVSTSTYGNAQADCQRARSATALSLLLAVLEKRAGLNLVGRRRLRQRRRRHDRSTSRPSISRVVAAVALQPAQPAGARIDGAVRRVA